MHDEEPCDHAPGNLLVRILAGGVFGTHDRVSRRWNDNGRRLFVTSKLVVIRNDDIDTLGCQCGNTWLIARTLISGDDERRSWMRGENPLRDGIVQPVALAKTMTDEERDSTLAHA